jgi:hypothetical protein
MPDNYRNLYFPKQETLDCLDEICKRIGTSTSALINNTMEAVLPDLLKASKQNKREVSVQVTIPLFVQKRESK